MSTTVQSVMTAIETQAATTFGSGWSKLRNVYDLSNLDGRAGNNSYGARPLAAADSPTHAPFKTYALNHRFEVILTDRVPERSDDDSISSKIQGLYDKADELYKDMVNTRIGIAAVCLVNNISIEEPELLEGQQLVALRMQFDVIYRQSL